MHALIDELRKNEIRLDTQSRLYPKEDEQSDKVSVLVFSPLKHEMSLLALGALSVYHEINMSISDFAWADRAFFYDFLFDDFDQIKDIYYNESLISFEQKIPVKDFDVIAFGMTHPGGIKDFARFMKLAGIPLLRRDRESGGYPIIIGGGPGFTNPEPYGDMVDAFIVGAGATISICAFVKILAEFKGKSRKKILEDASRVDGIYVPDMYDHIYGENNKLLSIRTLVRNDGDYGLNRQENFQEQAHHFSSRIIGYKTGTVVVSMGCRYSCAFCQIGMQKLQSRPYENVIKVIDELFAFGITKLIINSPTFTQFEGRNDLLDYIAKRVKDYDLSDFKLYIGSVRIDEIDEEYLGRLSSFNDFNHTYLKYINDSHNSFIAVAPEFGTDRLMQLMGKGLTRSKILKGIHQAIKFGIKNFHCYFLVGIESETIKDRLAIVSLVRNMMDITGSGSKFYLKINLYIPTVGTIGQRMPMNSVREYDSFLKDINIEIDKLFSLEERKNIEIIRLEEERLLFESFLMRGGRNIRPVLLKALSDFNTGLILTEDNLKNMCDTINIQYSDLLAGFSIDDILPWDYVYGAVVEKRREKIFLADISKNKLRIIL